MTFQIQAKIDQFALPHPSGEGDFKISVARVADPDGKDALPVLFVLDADIGFALAAEIARLNAVAGGNQKLLVVGIGYDAAFADFAKLRTGDLTPPLSEAGAAAIEAMTTFIGDQQGGAEAFLTFLTDTLAPEIGRLYPEASPTNRILFGHSLGGLFTAYALLTRPDAFATFLPSSPSLWWDNFAILSHLPAFAEKVKQMDVLPRVHVAVGAKEQDLPKKVPPVINMTLDELQAMIAHSRMVDAAAEFAASLRESGLPDTGYYAFVDEDHGTVVPAAMMRGLTFAIPRAE